MADISVIIPVKNRADLLRITLRNLLNQSKKPDEIIVVNDHSSDDFHLVVLEFITEGTFVHSKGSGPGAARNTGLEIASGKYIQFFDSDDLMTTNKLETQFNALENTGADIAYGPYVMAYEAENDWKQKDVIMQASPLPEDKSLMQNIVRGWNCITQACLFRHDLIKKAGPWNEKLITHEDYLYMFHVAKHYPKMVHVPDSAVLYRQHGLQSTENQTKTLSRAQDKIEVLVEMVEKLPSKMVSGFEERMLYGRLYQTILFWESQGGNPKKYAGYKSWMNGLNAQLYKISNKKERMKTGNAWESMHGTSADPELFNAIIKNIQ